MILEFSQEEIIDILQQLGYELAKDENSEMLESYRKFSKKKKSFYVVTKDGNKTIEEVFKQEIINKILKQ